MNCLCFEIKDLNIFFLVWPLHSREHTCFLFNEYFSKKYCTLYRVTSYWSPFWFERFLFCRIDNTGYHFGLYVFFTGKWQDHCHTGPQLRTHYAECPLYPAVPHESPQSSIPSLKWVCFQTKSTNKCSCGGILWNLKVNKKIPR